MNDLPCVCGHRNDKHTKSNGKAMDRINEQLRSGYIDTPENRKNFWYKFLSEIRLEEFGCSKCKCDSFRQDNLKYLEDLYEGKKK